MPSKKTALLTSFLLCTALVLGACGDDDDDVTKDTTNNDTSNDIEDTDIGTNPADLPAYTFGFSYFELHVDFQNKDDSIDVLYHEKKHATDVEYKNTLTDEKGTGSNAMGQLEPRLESLSIKEDHTVDEVIDQIVKAFQIKEDFSSIEATITYLDGEKKEYILTK
jgi:hypothetical protein